MTWLAAVRDGLELVESAIRIRPGVIVVDLNMPHLNELDAMRRQKAQGVESKFVFLTMDRDPALALEAFRAGAAAYLIKHAASEELPRAIREVVNGRTYLTSQISGRLPDC